MKVLRDRLLRRGLLFYPKCSYEQTLDLVTRSLLLLDVQRWDVIDFQSQIDAEL